MPHFFICYTPEYAAKPQSIGRTTPVIADAERSSQRKSVAPNNSEESTNLFIGVPLSILALRGVGVPSSLKSKALF